MKKLTVIFLLIFGFNTVVIAQDSLQRQAHQTIAQVQDTQNEVEKNAKAITLLTIAVSSMASLIIALLLYIKKSHSKTISIATKFVEATMAMSQTHEKLATSIDNSGDKISSAVDRQERTTNDLHKFLLDKMR